MKNRKKRMRWKGFILIFILFLSCSSEKKIPALNFYHWQSYFDVNPDEISYLEDLGTDTLYIRYFDVDWQNNELEAVGKIINKNLGKFKFKIIPVVFITNRTFLRHPDLDDLSEKILKLIRIKHAGLSEIPIDEIQFDCDWSSRSRDIYFKFLETFQTKSKFRLSATIRLHQIKYVADTGVPPVDRFVLMCYNTGEITDIDENNSILEVEDVKKYASSISDYPEDLVLALPLFSWGVLYREGKMIQLIRNPGEELDSNKDKYGRIGNKFRVLQSTYLKGYYLYKGDELRLEWVSLNDLIGTVDILKKEFIPEEIIFYHLDSSIIKRFPYEQLENISHRFIEH